MDDRVWVVGPGRAGLSLAYALWESGAVASLAVSGRRRDPPLHPHFGPGGIRYVCGPAPPERGTTALILAVPDHAIFQVAQVIARLGEAPPACAAYHLSGVSGTDPLAPLADQGYLVGVLHPLQALADPLRGARRLRGSFFGVSGVPEAVVQARRLVCALGGHVLLIPSAKRALYHAGAVFASNVMVAALAVAQRILVGAGVPAEEAQEALLVLARGSLENVEALGLAGALTGPVVRGDAETVDLHLRALERRDRSLYVSWGRELVRLAVEAGLSGEALARLSSILEKEP